MKYFDNFAPLDGDHYKGKPEKVVKDNVRTGAPWVPIKSEFQSFDVPLAGAEKEEEPFEPGSLEEAFADRRATMLISDKFRQNDSNIRQAFRKADDDRSGSIDINEFVKCMRKLGMGIPTKQLQRIFHSVDDDGSGTIDYEEFVNEFNGDKPTVGRKVAAHESAPATPPPLTPLSQAAGSSSHGERRTSGDGEVARINAAQRASTPASVAKDVAFLREKLSQRSKNIAGVFRRYDANGDGHLSAEELHRGFQDMGMDIGMDSVTAILRAANPRGVAKEMHFKDFCSFVVERGGAPIDSRGGAASAPLWLDDPAGEGVGGGMDKRQLFGASPIPVGGHQLRPSSRDSVVSAYSRRSTGVARHGRFASTPFEYDTKHMVQPVATQSSPMVRGRTFGDCLADSQAEVRERARANREAVLVQRHAAKMAYEEARKAADEKKARALDESRLASRELQTRRYLERMRLYEVAGSGGGMNKEQQRNVLEGRAQELFANGGVTESKVPL